MADSGGYVMSATLAYIGGHPDGPSGGKHPPNVVLAATATEASVWTYDRKRRLFAFPLADVENMTFEQFTPDRYRGWTFTTGLLGMGRRTAGLSSVTFSMRDGTVVVFAAQAPPGQVRAELSPMTAAIRSAQSSRD